MRKAVRRKVIPSAEKIEQFKIIIDEPGPKLNAFINATK
jgi:hypothetical protein